MTDKLCINGLAVDCRIGVTEAERAKPQTVWIDLTVPINASKASAHDDVREAVDYARLVDVVTRQVLHRPHHLLETLAEEIATVILQEFHTPEVTVRATKRALPTIESASVEVTRTLLTSDDDND